MTERARSRKPEDPVEVPELPALPDGGLGANMPSWLRQAPAFMPPPSEEPASIIDPGSLTGGLVLPEWLSELSARVERGSADPGAKVSAPIARVEGGNTPDDQPPAAAPALTTEKSPLQLPATSAIAQTPRDQQPATPEPYIEPPYRRIGLLLIIFAIGVIVFTIWSATN